MDTRAPRFRRTKADSGRTIKFNQIAKFTGEILCGRCKHVLLEIRKAGTAVNLKNVRNTLSTNEVWNLQRMRDDDECLLVQGECPECRAIHHIKLKDFKMATSIETGLRLDDLVQLIRIIDRSISRLERNDERQNDPEPAKLTVFKRRWRVLSTGVYCTGNTHVDCENKIVRLVRGDYYSEAPETVQIDDLRRLALGRTSGADSSERLLNVFDTGFVRINLVDSAPALTPYELHVRLNFRGTRSNADIVSGRCHRCGIRHDFHIDELLEIHNRWTVNLSSG